MPPLRRSAVIVVAVTAVVLLGWLVFEGVGSVGPVGASGPEPLWIWDEGAPSRPGDSHAFVAHTSFQLEQRLEETRGEARALVVADEEYVLDLNGVWIGGGRYEPLPRWDGYEVTDLLQAGRNRIAVEVRSARGMGGLLFCLEVDGRCVARSDGEWRIGRPAAAASGGGASVRVWGGPEVGRWPVPESVRERRRYDRCLVAGSPVHPRRIFRAPWREPIVGVEPVWWANFGGIVKGALLVEMPATGPAPWAARFGLGRTMPEPAPPTVPIVAGASDRSYRFPEPLRLYFVEFIGGESPTAAAVRPLRPGCDELLTPPRPSPDGVFGVPPVEGYRLD